MLKGAGHCAQGAWQYNTLLKGAGHHMVAHLLMQQCVGGGSARGMECRCAHFNLDK